MSLCQNIEAERDASCKGCHWNQSKKQNLSTDLLLQSTWK